MDIRDTSIKIPAMSPEYIDADDYITADVADEELTDRAYWEQERKKVLWDFLIFFAAVVIVAIAIGTVAWFASNKDVGGNGMAVSAEGSLFELEVRGDFIENSEVMTTNTLLASEFRDGIQQADGQGNAVNIFRTGGGKEKIVWRKNAQSAVSPKELRPGSRGELAFWVIPNQTGVMNLNFEFNIRGYHAVYEGETVSELIEITDDLTDSEENAGKGITSADNKKTALGYVNSHILFFKNYDSSTEKYSGFCGEDTIKFTDFISGNDKTVVKDQAYPVTIYWIWVNDFGDMFLPSTSAYARTPIFADSNTADREAIFTYLGDTNRSIFSGMSSTAISTALTDIQNSSGETFKTSLTSLTMGYDNADLHIGNNLNYILIEMTAVPE